jgi:integrase
MGENTVNKALRVMGMTLRWRFVGMMDMACSSLIESGLWSRDAVERQMSHMERNSVRAAYIHKAEHLDERELMFEWWADYLDMNRNEGVSPFDFGKLKRKNRYKYHIMN